VDVAKRGVIVGMALGDGYVQVRQRLQRGKYPYEQRSMKMVHGPMQRAYCEWKAKRLGWALGGRQINVTKVKNGPGGRYDAYHFTVSHPYFGQLRRWLYPEGKKRFTRRVLDMLTPEGLAIWYMDDGSARRNLNKEGFVSSVATSIATYCSEVEARVIVEWLDETYGVKFSPRFDKRIGSYYVQGNTTASREFVGVTAPYIPECMKYKLSHVAMLSSHERQAPIGVCAGCGETLYDARRKGLCVQCYHKRRRAMR